MAESLQATFAHDKSITVASIYCNYKDRTAQTPVNLLANIWSQLQEGSLDPEVESLHDRQSNARPRLDDVCKILRAEVNKFSKVFVIVDALDECEPAYRLRLLTELRALSPKLKLLVTSRFFDSSGADISAEADIEILASDADLARYIQERAQETPRLARWIASNVSLLPRLIENVTNAAQQM